MKPCTTNGQHQMRGLTMGYCGCGYLNDLQPTANFLPPGTNLTVDLPAHCPKCQSTNIRTISGATICNDCPSTAAAALPKPSQPAAPARTHA